MAIHIRLQGDILNKSSYVCYCIDCKSIALFGSNWSQTTKPDDVDKCFCVQNKEGQQASTSCTVAMHRLERHMRSLLIQRQEAGCK